ncbi:MAG TPA: carbonic anhydrase family protein [Burkholderiaceae bacterium]|jgi:carbonic anhydrase
MPPILSLRPLHCALVAACLVAGAGLSQAAEHAEAPKTVASGAVAEHGALEKTAKAEKTEKVEKAEKVSAPEKLTERGPRDPMDMLREKLAAKLGAARNPDGSVVRVVSKASAEEADDDRATLTLAPRPSRRRPAPIARGEPHEAPRPVNWDYGGSGGPDAWGQMKPEFAKCSSGTRQSPIDIQDGIKVNLDPVQFDYRASGFRVIDNGHTVQVNVAPGNTIDVMGRRYELMRFDFQRPSEERIDGRQFDMGIHLVHKDADGHLAVVALLLERGAAQAVVQSVWNNLPLEKGDELAARTPLNPADLLPVDRGYFTYMGSMTTPPCSEGVLWMVMKQPVQLSAEQLGIFARLYPMNARPIQSASGRLIKESN